MIELFCGNVINRNRERSNFEIVVDRFWWMSITGSWTAVGIWLLLSEHRTSLTRQPLIASRRHPVPASFDDLRPAVVSWWSNQLLWSVVDDQINCCSQLMIRSAVVVGWWSNQLLWSVDDQISCYGQLMIRPAVDDQADHGRLMTRSDVSSWCKPRCGHLMIRPDMVSWC